MGRKDSLINTRPFEDCRIIRPTEFENILNADDVETRIAAAKSAQNVVVEVFVSQPHNVGYLPVEV